MSQGLGVTTTGRRRLRQVEAGGETRKDVAAGGTTVLLTTQYLDEADQLAHEIAVIDTGRVIASGTASELKPQIGGDRVEGTVRETTGLAHAVTVLAAATGAEPQIEPVDRRVSASTNGGSATLTVTVRELDRLGVETDDIGLRRPTLDDVFLRLTGHATGQNPPTGESEAA